MFFLASDAFKAKTVANILQREHQIWQALDFYSHWLEAKFFQTKAANIMSFTWLGTLYFSMN